MSGSTAKAKEYRLTIWSRKLRLILAVLTAGILWAASFRYLYNGFGRRFLVGTAMSLLTGALLVCPRPKAVSARCLLALLYVALVPLRMFQCMEQPIHAMWTLQKGAALWNVLIIALVYALLLLLFQRAGLAFGCGGILFLLYFLLNFYHMRSQGCPFLFRDWSALKEALPLLNGHQPVMEGEAWYSILHFLFFIALGFWCDIPPGKGMRYHLSVTGLSLVFLLFFGCFQTLAYPSMAEDPKETAWESLLRRGSLLALYDSIGNAPAEPPWYERFPVVCHAAGMTAEGIAGTNSREALEHNYALGHRLFEVDISIASDGVAVLRHDWDADLGQAEKLGLAQGAAPASDAFLQAPILGQYTPMALLDLYRMMAEREDMYVIIDPKYTEDVIGQFSVIVDTALDNGYESVLHRIIVQLYYEEMYDAVEAVHHFDNYLFTLYYIGYPGREEVGAFCRAHGIPVVVMPYAWIDESMCQDMAACSVRLYGHTVDDPEDARRMASLGADGIYSDNLLPKDMRERLLEASPQP